MECSALKFWSKYTTPEQFILIDFKRNYIQIWFAVYQWKPKEFWQRMMAYLQIITSQLGNRKFLKNWFFFFFFLQNLIDIFKKRFQCTFLWLMFPFFGNLFMFLKLSISVSYQSILRQIKGSATRWQLFKVTFGGAMINRGLRFQARFEREETRLELSSRIGGTETRLMFSGLVTLENSEKIWGF